ncbi:hypothetical protein IC582_022181 [Cucumis melo]|uniref:O-fucosyltransferase family protein n=1 Tax=Cucumis melo TaxID=3656 RepID=A0A1S3AT28_CUCME|nr:O-fucosyltransferase 30 [Cucumis melo]
MNVFGSTRSSINRWNSKKPNLQLRRFSLSVFVLLFCFFFLLYLSSSFSSSTFISSTAFSTSNSRQCNTQILGLGEKFLFYAPHSGFSNQLSEFKNAILMAGILNRTLVVPPILDHHAVALGSCPKFRVPDPGEIRFSVWEHMLQLLRNGRYVSMTDIVDISSLTSYSSVKAIDFRTFAYLWCGVHLESVCSNEYNNLKQCGRLLAGLDGNVDKCLHAVDEDCKTTVWTYQSNEVDGALDLFQPNEQLKKKKKVSYVRRRRDVYRTLGPDSKAGSATVLAFGSLFTAPYKGSELYIDIHGVSKDQRISSLMKNIEYLPFVPEILSAGKEYIDKIIKAPFLCAQLRLLDGQFKNHWKATFLALQQKLNSILENANEPIRVFVMTDLPESNWTGSYLGDLDSDSNHFKLFFLKEHDELVLRASKKVMAVGHGLRWTSNAFGPGRIRNMKKECAPERLPDVLLYIEETVCSCASLGFVGTAGSTIAESIELMRKYGVCRSQTWTKS